MKVRLYSVGEILGLFIFGNTPLAELANTLIKLAFTVPGIVYELASVPEIFQDNLAVTVSLILSIALFPIRIN